MKAYGGLEVELYTFLTWTLDFVQWPPSSSGRLPRNSGIYRLKYILQSQIWILNNLRIELFGVRLMKAASVV